MLDDCTLWKSSNKVNKVSSSSNAGLFHSLENLKLDKNKPSSSSNAGLLHYPEILKQDQEILFVFTCCAIKLPGNPQLKSANSFFKCWTILLSRNPQIGSSNTFKCWTNHHLSLEMLNMITHLTYVNCPAIYHVQNWGFSLC
jgi:hypothetical protein